MSVRWWLLGLTSVAVAACGAGTSPTYDDPTRDRLLDAADRAAQSNGGEAKHVEAVKTTRGRAADLTGHSNLDQSEEIWVLQVSGDDYVCRYCHTMRRRAAPKGRYITVVFRASDFETTDGGLGPEPTDLEALGAVEVLRD